MEIEIQMEKVHENITRYFANGLLSDAGENGIAQLLEQSSSYPCSAVWDKGISTVVGDVTVGRGDAQASIIAPPTVQAVPPTAAKSIFIESTIVLK